MKSLFTIICYLLCARLELGSCTLHMRCGNFLTSAVSITATDVTNSSNVLRCGVVVPQGFSTFQEITGEIFNVTYSLNVSGADEHPVGVVSTGSHHGNMSIIIYGEENNTKIWLFTGSRPPAHLGIDKASVRVYNLRSDPINISELYADCYKCKPHMIGSLYPGEDWYLMVDTNFEYTLTFDSNRLNQLSHLYVEHAQYNLTCTVYQPPCDLRRVKDGDNPYLPILWTFCVLAVLTAVAIVLYFLLNYFKLGKWCYVDPTDRQIAMDLGNPKSSLGSSSESHAQLMGTKSVMMISESRPLLSSPAGGEAQKKIRLKSLDCFRGFSLMIMIFVNYGGGGYWFFKHSKWNGLTVADLVFPWFMWIMGVSIVYSFHGRQKSGVLLLLYQIVRRSIILFSLGLFLNNGYVLDRWRILGVLQRFALSYFVVAITELLSPFLYRFVKIPMHRYFADILSNWIQLLVALCLITINLLFTFLLPLDDHCPTGYLGPGGISENGRYQNCTGGAALQIDRWILTYRHIYQHPTCKELYHTGPFDPEGILGTLNSIALCFLGLQAGKILANYQSHKERIARFLIWGIALGLVGGALAYFKQNGGWIPINKNLWSLSFILVMAGTAFVLLSIMYFCIDTIRWWNGVPFIYPGMNSILVYCGSELLEGYFPFSWEQKHETHLSLLASNVIAVGLWILIAYYCYRIRFFVKV